MTNPLSKLLQASLIGAGAVIIFIGIYLLSPLLSPFLLAMFMAMLLTPLFHRLKNKGWPTWLALVSIIVGLFLVGFLILAFIWIAFSQFAAQLPDYQAAWNQQMTALESTLAQFGLPAPDLGHKTSEEVWNLVRIGLNVLLSVGNMLFGLFLILLTIIFMLLESAEYPVRLQRSLGANHPFIAEFTFFNRQLIGYIIARLKVNLFTGVSATIFLWLMGIDFALVWGVLFFFLSFIPYLGITLASIPPAILGFAQGGLVEAVVIILGFVVINAIAENVVATKLTADTLSLSPVVVIVALFFWSFILGTMGMFLGMPLTVLIVMLLSHFDETRWLAALMTRRPEDKLAPPAAKESTGQQAA